MICFAVKSREGHAHDSTLPRQDFAPAEVFWTARTEPCVAPASPACPPRRGLTHPARIDFRVTTRSGTVLCSVRRLGEGEARGTGQRPPRLMFGESQRHMRPTKQGRAGKEATSVPRHVIDRTIPGSVTVPMVWKSPLPEGGGGLSLTQAFTTRCHLGTGESESRVIHEASGVSGVKGSCFEVTDWSWQK